MNISNDKQCIGVLKGKLTIYLSIYLYRLIKRLEQYTCLFC